MAAGVFTEPTSQHARAAPPHSATPRRVLKEGGREGCTGGRERHSQQIAHATPAPREHQTLTEALLFVGGSELLPCPLRCDKFISFVVTCQKSWPTSRRLLPLIG
ncbi:hypothetical protein E2C01_064986 [Portunus trituberculatus]|uniref:Uncharacterized protein n=1 Tax=Portunus trituberculatus TaxID=210409 RepID=A0A5B7HHN3_PORTR|nr:hypothetical protein [Portunus trituberculatus]